MDKYDEAKSYISEYLYDSFCWGVQYWRYDVDRSTASIKFNIGLLTMPDAKGSKSIYIPCIRKGINLRVNTL